MLPFVTASRRLASALPKFEIGQLDISLGLLGGCLQYTRSCMLYLFNVGRENRDTFTVAKYQPATKTFNSLFDSTLYS